MFYFRFIYFVWPCSLIGFIWMHDHNKSIHAALQRVHFRSLHCTDESHRCLITAYGWLHHDHSMLLGVQSAVCFPIVRVMHGSFITDVFGRHVISLNSVTSIRWTSGQSTAVTNNNYGKLDSGRTDNAVKLCYVDESWFDYANTLVWF